MKKRYIILIAVVIVLAAGFFVIRGMIKSGEAAMAQIEITDVDLTGAQDGVYTGSAEAFPVSAEVSVTVENEQISAVELVKHDHGKGADAEVLPGRVVNAQSVEIDTVSGATSSSKIILKAIENALREAAGTR